MDELVNIDAAVPEGDFYVTARDRERLGFLLGPYTDYRDALANKRRGINLAVAAEPFAHFFHYGTVRLPIGTPCRTVFGR